MGGNSGACACAWPWPCDDAEAGTGGRVSASEGVYARSATPEEGEEEEWNARYHDVHDHACAPAVRGHADVAEVFVFEREDALGRQVGDRAADVEGLFVGPFAREAEVGELYAGVWAGRIQEDVLGLRTALR